MTNSVRESSNDSIWMVLGFIYEAVRRREMRIREAILGLVLVYLLWSMFDSDGPEVFD